MHGVKQWILEHLHERIEYDVRSLMFTTQTWWEIGGCKLSWNIYCIPPVALELDELGMNSARIYMRELPSTIDNILAVYAASGFSVECMFKEMVEYVISPNVMVFHYLLIAALAAFFGVSKLEVNVRLGAFSRFYHIDSISGEIDGVRCLHVYKE